MVQQISHNRNIGNLFYEEAVTREASRAKLRNFYKAKSGFDLRQIQVTPGGVPPVQPDQLDDPIPEPLELEEFLAIIQETFQAASAVYLEDLHAFSALHVSHSSSWPTDLMKSPCHYVRYVLQHNLYIKLVFNF